MSDGLTLHPIAHIQTDFPTKFGIPRQSGLANTRGRIVFESEYRDVNALRGIEQYSHLWVLWEFSEAKRESWSPTVRPPRLGGNERVGVFASRSPFRPNPIGLSCVKLEEVVISEEEGPVLLVSGVDILDGTPIYDIKPYLPYVDSHPEAEGGFAEKRKDEKLEVVWDAGIELPDHVRTVLEQILSQDPRPSYQEDAQRVYGMEYAGLEVRFRVEQGMLIVCSAEEIK